MKVNAIRANLTEEVDLLRYVLRLNSTKMRRGAWQSKSINQSINQLILKTYQSSIHKMFLSLNVFFYAADTELTIHELHYS